MISKRKIAHILLVAKSHKGESWYYPRTFQATAIHYIVQHLQKKKIKFRLIDRRSLKKPISNVDLVITIGGDGTFLTTAHFCGEIPMLGVNAMPAISTGFFCGATVKTFSSVFEKIFGNRLHPKKFFRMNVRIHKKNLPILALNDVLFTSNISGDMTRYFLSVNGKREFQKSSGVWIATSAGSTAGIYSAGGKRDPLSSPRLQYWVREPVRYPRSICKHTHGFIAERKTLRLTPQSNNTVLFIDGPQRVFPVPMGKTVYLTCAKKPLNIFR